MTRTAKDQLYQDLKRRVLTMELEPGADLDETRISAEYGVSRTPLRDVFRRLAGEGYLEIRDNRGATVAPMTHKTLRYFFMTAPMIYAAVGRLAAQNATARQLDQLRDAQARFRSAVEAEAVDDMVYWNDRFHHIIGEMSDNPYLLPSLRRLLVDHARIGQTFWRARDRDMRQRIDAAAAHHDRFIELIAAGDVEGVVALTKEHWALSQDHMEMFVRPDPLPEEIDDQGERGGA
jgi:DNA-binding GntR family transcriptional regulator